METLLAALLLVVVCAVGFTLLALPFALIVVVLRSPRSSAPRGYSSGSAEWTDDDWLSYAE